MASPSLGKYASITAVDLIQLKKLNSPNFYESNPTEARFDSLPNNDSTPLQLMELNVE